MESQPVLGTKRLILRPFVLGDAPEVQRLAGDYEVASRSLEIPYPYEDGVAEAWISTHRYGFGQQAQMIFAITHRAEGYLLGAVGLVDINRRHERAEIGYWVGRPYWGRGYATEAASAVIEYGFAVLCLHRIYATHFTRNPASGRVMQKCGMTHEGRLREHVRKWGANEDVDVYGLLQDEWQQIRTGRTLPECRT
jgi:[ribosomal protein S5]-alanine N-acetyltransferase